MSIGPAQPEGSPPRLEQLAERAANTLDFREGLRSLTDLRGRLDELEAMHVTAALGAGATWSDVAAELGISKQAAHRRHAARVREAARTPLGESRRVLVTAEARRAVQLARQEAAAMGHALVGTEHLVLGILRSRDTAAARALAALGVELEGARAAAEPTLVEEDPGQAAGAQAPGRRGLTPHAREVLERSLAETLARSEGYIGVEHLLLALVRDIRGGAARTLERFQVTADDVRRQLALSW